MLMWFLTSLHWLVSSAYSTTSRGSCHAPNVTHHTPRTICHRLTSRAARFISCATSRHYINCYSFIYLRVCQPKKKKKEHEKLFFLKAPFRRKTLTSKSKLTRNGIKKKNFCTEISLFLLSPTWCAHDYSLEQTFDHVLGLKMERLFSLLFPFLSTHFLLQVKRKFTLICHELRRLCRIIFPLTFSHSGVLCPSAVKT